MSETLYLTRCRLKSDASLKALLPLLLGKANGVGSSQQAGHHLVWSLFADSPNRNRDFLWREMERAGSFLILSRRLPLDKHSLFVMDEPKPFIPMLEPGDKLGFSLRANPVIRRWDETLRRSRKHDVVMDALRNHPKEHRAQFRLSAIRDQGYAWLERQAGRSGFAVRPEDVRIDGYQQNQVSRDASSHSMSFSTLDFQGALEVRKPEQFLACISNGFGASKAYGCGLMLIRRV